MPNPPRQSVADPVPTESRDLSLAGEYSAQWRQISGASPDVFEFLELHFDATQEQRARIFLLDQARSWCNGNGRTVEEYMRQCPEIAADPDLLVKLVVHEYHLRDQQDVSASVSELVSRFPYLRSRLLEQIYSGDNERTSASSLPRIPERFQVDETADSSVSGLSVTMQTEVDGFSHGRATPPESLDATSTSDGSWANAWEKAREAGAKLEVTAASDGAVPESPNELPLRNPEMRALRDCFPFNTLVPVWADELERQMVEQTFAKDDYLIRQGDTGTFLLFLRKGTVAISVRDEHGVSHEIDTSGPGETLGEMSLLTEEPRSASIVACEPVTASVLASETFHEHALRHPEISQVLTKLLAKRLGHDRRDALTGKMLDQYRIIRRLGKGGMSVVYEGHDQRDSRRVALKMLSHRLVYDQSSLAWFQREADLVESFEHPNIVKMFGRFQAFRSFFIVMEFCDGITLERLIRLNGPLPEPEFRKVFGQLAMALQYAHERNVIHRDLKPVNLMLNFDGTLKLMDFGLAMPLGVPSSVAESDGRHIVGTPRYMAPEQLNGRELSKETDLFSLGCTVYKLLTGHSLFGETDVLKLCEMHELWKVPNFAKLHPEFSPEVCELLTGLLHRRAKKRVCDLSKYATWAAPLDVEKLL